MIIHTATLPDVNSGQILFAKQMIWNGKTQNKNIPTIQQHVYCNKRNPWCKYYTQKLTHVEAPLWIAKNKVLNRAFAKIVPNNTVFLKTHLLFDQLSLVICMNSLGFVQCLEHLLALVFSNNEYKMNPITKTWALKQWQELNINTIQTMSLHWQYSPKQMDVWSCNKNNDNENKQWRSTRWTSRRELVDKSSTRLHYL